jgi:hypothetical protein
MSHICENPECPICMDPIEGAKNCVTTECGHIFHAKCLMTSVAHNGFGCPYCRTAMAEIPQNDDDDEDEDYDGDDDDEYENDQDDALRGLRLFTNNLNGEQHDEDDIAEENDYLQDDEDTELQEPQAPLPTASFIANKLTQQGVTIEDLVKIMLLNHGEYDQQSEHLERLEGEMFGKMRIIISNFTPE